MSFRARTGSSRVTLTDKMALFTKLLIYVRLCASRKEILFALLTKMKISDEKSQQQT